MIMHITKEELRQALLFKITPGTVKRGINNLSILKLILIIRTLLMMNINHGIENYVTFVVYITMCLLSVRRMAERKEDEAWNTFSTSGKEEGKEGLEKENILQSLQQRWTSKSHMLEVPSRTMSQCKSAHVETS